MQQQTLAQAQPGQHVRLVAVGGDRILVRRLRALGLNIGNEIDVLHHRKGDVVIGKGGSRLALGHDIADLLLVEDID